MRCETIFGLFFKLKIYRKVVACVLFCIVCYCFVKSFWNYKAEPTAFEETEVEHEAIFPSMTICSRKIDGKMDNYTDFQDIKKSLDHARQFDYEALIEWWGKGVEQ